VADPTHDQGGPGAGRGLPGPISGSFTGVLARLEIEGGPWVLQVPDGPTYQLVGDLSPARLLLGLTVRVTGRLAPEVMTTAQVGPVVEVSQIVRDG